MKNKPAASIGFQAALGLFSGLILSLSGADAAKAEASAWVNTDISQIRLIVARDGAELLGGLHIRLEAGWKTYWRSPGDTGLPAVIDWTGSENVSAPRLTWPLPKRIEISGFQNLVYEDEVVLPLKLSARDAAKSVTLKAAVDYAVCKEVCVPLQANLSITLSPSASSNAAEAAQAKLIRRHAARVPAIGSTEGLSISEIGLHSSNEGEFLEVTLIGDGPLTSPGMIVEAPPPFSLAAPTVVRREGEAKVTLQMKVAAGRSKPSLSGRRIILTVYGGGRALEKSVLAPGLN